MKTKKPNKQRKKIYQAPLHRKHKLVSAHLSKELRKQFGRRSLPLRKGDEVTVMRGKFKGKTGKVSEVDLKRLKVYIDNVKRTRTTGEEAFVPIHPSKLLIINPVVEDPKRKEAIERGKKK